MSLELETSKWHLLQVICSQKSIFLTWHFCRFCFRFGKKPENFFNALRGCQNRVEPNAKILQQELKENPSLLLTLGKLREFFQDPYQSPTSHFNEKIRLNAIQFNRNWYEIHQVPPNSYVDLTKIHEFGQLIPPLDFEFFGLDYDMGKNRMGLVFDPKWGQLQLENFNEKFPYVCSHKREYRPGNHSLRLILIFHKRDSEARFARILVFFA